MTERKFCIGGRDKEQEKKEEKQRVKEEKAVERKRKREEMEKEEEESQRTAWSRLEEICGGERENEKVGQNDKDFVVRRAHRKSTRPPLYVPPDILSRPLVVENIIRFKLLPLAVVCLFSAVITECGGNIKVLLTY